MTTWLDNIPGVKDLIDGSGNEMPRRQTLRFSSDFTLTDDSANGETDIAIDGSGFALASPSASGTVSQLAATPGYFLTVADGSDGGTWSNTLTDATVTTGRDPGIILENPTDATSGSADRRSPSYRMIGNAWDSSGAANVEVSADLQARGVTTGAGIADALALWLGGTEILTFQSVESGGTEFAGMVVDDTVDTFFVSETEGANDPARFVIEQTAGATDGTHLRVLSGANGGGADGSVYIGVNGLTESIRLGGSSGSPTVGFFGSAGTTKPTVSGSRGGNAALQNLMIALSDMGLVVDSTS